MVYRPVSVRSGQATDPRLPLVVPSHADAVIWILNARGEALAVDERVRDLLGEPAGDLLRGGENEGWWPRVHPGDRARVRKELKATFTLASPLDLECRLRGSNGRWVQVAVRATVLTRWNDEACVYLVTRRAMGERTARRRELRRLADYQRLVSEERRWE